MQLSIDGIVFYCYSHCTVLSILFWSLFSHYIYCNRYCSMHFLYIVKVIVIVRIVIVTIVIVMCCHCIHCYCTYCYCVLLLYPLLLYPLFIALVDFQYCISLLQYCSSWDSQMRANQKAAAERIYQCMYTVEQCMYTVHQCLYNSSWCTLYVHVCMMKNLYVNV